MLVLSLKKSDHLKIDHDEIYVKVVSMNNAGISIKTLKKQNDNLYSPSELIPITIGSSLKISDSLVMTCLKTKGEQMKVGFNGKSEVLREKNKIRFIKAGSSLSNSNTMTLLKIKDYIEEKAELDRKIEFKKTAEVPRETKKKARKTEKQIDNHKERSNGEFHKKKKKREARPFTSVRPMVIDDSFFNFDTEGY